MNLNKLFNNQVRCRHLDSEGRDIGGFVAKNTLTHRMSDIIMNALLQSGPSQINWLYARFGDSGANPGNLAPLNNDLTNTQRADFLASTDGIRGGLWVPLLFAPQQSSSNSLLYNGNTATFSVRIPYNIASAQVSPSANFNATTSYIYALGLAVAMSVTDRTQDVIVSALESFTPFPIPSGGQESIDYPLELDI